MTRHNHARLRTFVEEELAFDTRVQHSIHVYRGKRRSCLSVQVFNKSFRAENPTEMLALAACLWTVASVSGDGDVPVVTWL